MNRRESIRFKIDQLRKDKIIYAVEACATTLICLLGTIASNHFLAGQLNDSVHVILLAIALSYTFFMGIGNFSRLGKIRKLEKLLDNQ